jgi:hypothetical protein
MKVTKVKSEDGQVLVEPTRMLFWRARFKVFFSQLFRQFSLLNCNPADSLNLPNLFQKWFEYFHQNKS